LDASQSHTEGNRPLLGAVVEVAFQAMPLLIVCCHEPAAAGLGLVQGLCGLEPEPDQLAEKSNHGGDLGRPADYRPAAHHRGNPVTRHLNIQTTALRDRRVAVLVEVVRPTGQQIAHPERRITQGVLQGLFERLRRACSSVYIGLQLFQAAQRLLAVREQPGGDPPFRPSA
jgi:hypothetical protein